LERTPVANAAYTVYKQRLLDPNMAGQAAAATDLNTDTINVQAVSSAYTFSAAHTNYSQLSGAIGSPVTLTSPTVTGGVFDAADASLGTLAGGSTIAAYVIYKHNATAANAELIAYFDTDGSGNPISLATNGGTVTITFHASGIFSVM
jgi:hypothetical protein